MKNSFQLSFILLALMIFASAAFAVEVPVELFPLENYSQNVDAWIQPDDGAYQQRLLSKADQQKRLAILYGHYYGEHSPWSKVHVNAILQHAKPDDLQTLEASLLQQFSNEDKDKYKGYGENFRAHTKDWIESIRHNVNLPQLSGLHFEAKQRAIAIGNLHVRVLPTIDPHYYHFTQAGQGYPFDNLQMSALWVGTPLYVIAESQDHAWKLVITPACIGWVAANKVVSVDEAFVATWTAAAKSKLVAITKNQTSILDDNKQFLFTAYVGAMFPASQDGMMVPVANANKQAVIKTAKVSAGVSTVMPLAATPEHFAKIMKTLIGRPYGWGGMYFYNDCSQELKNLFVPFGIWLPRHSSAQVDEGEIIDLTLGTPESRLAYLSKEGAPFLTIVYIGGHVFLYLGQHQGANGDIALTYQNMWGLSPNPATRRAVVGRSVLLPLLLQYPEDASLLSQAAKQTFQASFLNSFPGEAQVLRNQHKSVNLRELMAL